MTTAEMLARLNELREQNGKPPLKAWKKARAALDEAIEAELQETPANPDEPAKTDDFEEDEEMLRDPARVVEALLAKTEANGCTPDEARKAREKAEEIAAKYGVEVPAAEEPKAKRRAADREPPKAARDARTIRECAEWFLKNRPDLKHAEIAERVREVFTDAKTTAASVAWYANKMRRRAEGK